MNFWNIIHIFRWCTLSFIPRGIVEHFVYTLEKCRENLPPLFWDRPIAATLYYSRILLAGWNQKALPIGWALGKNDFEDEVLTTSDCKLRSNGDIKIEDCNEHTSVYVVNDKLLDATIRVSRMSKLPIQKMKAPFILPALPTISHSWSSNVLLQNRSNPKKWKLRCMYCRKDVLKVIRIF